MIWYVFVERLMLTLSICIQKRKTLSLYVWISALLIRVVDLHMRKCISITTHTPIRKVEGYGVNNMWWVKYIIVWLVSQVILLDVWYILEH